MSRGLRLSLSRRLLTHASNRFARFVTWVSFIGLSLGVMVLTVVVTVMNGFDNELKTRLLNSVPHITVVGPVSDPRQIEGVGENLGGYYRFFEGVGGINGRGRVLPVGIYGVDDPLSVSHFTAHQVQGSVDRFVTTPMGIMLGEPLARTVGLRIGDTVTVITAKGTEQSMSPQMLSFELTGTFQLGAEPDYTVAIVNLDRMSEVEWSAFGKVGWQVQLRDPLQVREAQALLQERYPDAAVASWETKYGELFQAVQLEKSMMFVLLLLVVAIAAFNIVAGQSMLVNDKRRSIAILRTMGCTQSLIRDVFLLQGGSISLAGTVLGLGLGLLAANYVNEILDFGQAVTGMHLLDGSFFVTVPIRVEISDLCVIGGMSIAVCMLSAWFPAHRAAALDPVPALH